MSIFQSLREFNGVMLNTVVKQEAFELLKEFPVRPDDTWVTTFPKSGTGWMQQIVKLVLSGGVEDGIDVLQSIPWLEHAEGLDATLIHQYYDSFQLAPSPRVFKSHFTYDTMPYGSSLPDTPRYRHIYVARNPKDVLTFYYHHIQGFNYHVYKPSWDELFIHFLKGEVEGGDWFKHVLSFWAHKDDDNILFVKYEDMKKDLPAAVAAVAKFMGYDLTQSTIDEIAKKCDFEAMKDYNFTTLIGSVDPTASPYIRKGVVGDWKNHFTPEQSAQFDAIYAERVKGTGLVFEFE